MLSAAGSLRWLRDIVGGTYDELVAEAARWPAGTEGLTFLPYLQGERTPHADPSARAMFEGLSLRHDRGALVRSVLEGVAYGLRDSLELLKALGVEPAAGRASGGGARSELWLKIVASVLGLPIERTAVEEGAAYGAALLGGVAVRRLRLGAGGGRRVRPRARHGRARSRLAARLRRWLRAVPVPVPGDQRSVMRDEAEQKHHSEAVDVGARRGRDAGGVSFEGRVAFVTGASGGIGAAVARMLHDDGASVGLASRRGDGLGLERGLGVACDVRDPDAVDAAVAATVERFGGLDIVVANAGVGAYGPFLELSREHLEEMVDTNLKGTLYAIRAALPHLLKSDAADVITLASEAGRRGLPYEAVYCASKFGQVGFTRALDHELREQGVRCTNVCPGGVATEFALEEGRGRTPDALPGMMTAEDVAEIVMFVLTRPRTHRILETAIRPMTETSWG